jgi:pimeloyl-ACP methyl ester carboxylesterase
MNTSLTASVRPRFRTIAGLRIRYADSGGPHESVMLLTGPWPESIYAFARIWNTLAKHARLVAVDLPGFGASKRREDLLSPRAMGGFLAQLVVEADLRRPHIVAPTRFVRTTSPATRETGSSNRCATRPIVEWGIPDHGALQRLAGIQSPTLVLQGDNDLMIPTKLSHLLTGLMPDAQMRTYPDAAHGFLFQYPNELAAAVTDFLAAHDEGHAELALGLTTWP